MSRRSVRCRDSDFGGGPGSARGRRADGALDDTGGKVAGPDLASARVEALELGGRQADADLAVQHADRRRHRTGLAYAPLGLGADGGAFAARETVGNERRLEGDHRRRRSDLLGDADHGIAPICATQRAAASAASSAPPTRNPAASASPAPVVSTTDTSRA